MKVFQEEQEAGISSTNASSSNITRHSRKSLQQGNSIISLSNNNFNSSTNNSSATKGNSQFINGMNINSKGLSSSQIDQYNKGFVHNNRKLVMNSGGGSSGGGGFNQYNTQNTMTWSSGGANQIRSLNETNNANQYINPNNNNFSNNIPLQYQSNKNSQILRMGELIEYLLGKGYMRDACDSFLDYVYQLLCDEFCEGSEEIQLKESALLYKLSTKFSAYLMQHSQQSSSNSGTTRTIDHRINQQHENDLDNSYIILQFIQKVLKGVQKKHEETMYIKWKANHYSNLAIYYIRRHDYTLALNYFNLSLQMYNSLSAVIEQRQKQQHYQQNIGDNNQSNENDTIQDNSNLNYLDEDIQTEDQKSNQQASPQQTQNNPEQDINYLQNNENNFQQFVDKSQWAIQESIVMNNLAVLHGIMDDLDRAEELLIQSVAQSENEIFKQIKNVQTNYLRKDKQFLEKLPVLIYGYIFCEGVRKKKQILNEPSILQGSDNIQQPQRLFLKNAYSLSKKFFGEDNPFTLKIDIFRKRFALHNQHSDILAETFPFEIDIQKLKNTKNFLQQNKSEFNRLNELFGQENSTMSPMQYQLQSANVSHQMIPRQQSYTRNRVSLDSQMAEDLFNDKSEVIFASQVDKSNLRKGRNRSMHQISQGTNSKIYSNSGRPFPVSPGINSVQQQYQQGLIGRNIQYRSQNQFRIQTQTNNKNIPNKQNTQHQSNNHNYASKSNTFQDENQKSMQDEIRILQQSLAMVENQLKQIKHVNSQNDGQQNVKNDVTDLNKYKKEITKFQNGQNSTDIQKQFINQQFESGNDGETDNTQPHNQAYIINNNYTNKSNQQQQRVHSNQSSTNSIRDERSNSNGSIKPSQFKKESKEKHDSQYKQYQHQFQNQNEQNSKQYEHHSNNFKSKADEEQSTSRFSAQSKQQQPNNKDQSAPYLNSIYNQDNQKQPQSNNTNQNSNIKHQTPNSQPNNINQNGNISANSNQSSNTIGGGSFSQNKQGMLNQNFKSSLKDIDRKKQTSLDRQEFNFKQELRQQQIQQNQQTQPQTMKESVKFSTNNQVSQNQKEQHKKYSTDEKHDTPKLASLLQQQQNYQISKITETIVKNLQVDQVFVLKKRISLKDTNESYVVKCGVLYNKQEKGYKISISSFVGQNQSTAKVEEIELSILTNLLCFVSFQDVLPSTMNLDSINNLYDVCKYFILPFVGLQNKQSDRQSIGGSNISPSQISELEGKVIMVNPRAHGILSEYHKTVFLEQNVLIQFNYIEGFQFRIVICDKETNKINLRIDIEYDEGSFNNLYTTTEKDEYNAQKLSDFFDGTNESEISKQGMELVHRDIEVEGLKTIQKKKLAIKTEEYFIQSVKIQNFSQFNTHFNNIIKEFERIIKQFSTHTNLDNISKDITRFRVRVYQGLKKSVTIIVTDSQNSYYPSITSTPISNNINGVRVILFNNFDSFGAQGVKIKEKGEQILAVKEIKKMYGLNYDSLQNEQKLILYSLCSYHFNLGIIEKKEESMQKQPSKIEENNIIRIPTVSGGESTFLITGLDNYNYPITLEIFGSKDIFLGIKITLYNPIISEEQGIFLTTNHNCWHFQNEILKKKLHHFVVDSLPLSNYFITHIFKKIAVPVLFSNLYIENINPQNVQQGSPISSNLSNSSPYPLKNQADSKHLKTNSPKLLGTKGLIADNCIIIRLETLLDPNSVINYFLPQNKR